MVIFKSTILLFVFYLHNIFFLPFPSFGLFECFMITYYLHYWIIVSASLYGFSGTLDFSRFDKTNSQILVSFKLSYHCYHTTLQRVLKTLTMYLPFIPPLFCVFVI